jgi:hypothetical protein
MIVIMHHNLLICVWLKLKIFDFSEVRMTFFMGQREYLLFPLPCALVLSAIERENELNK